VCDVSNNEDAQVYAEETMIWGIKTWEGKKQQCKVEEERSAANSS